MFMSCKVHVMSIALAPSPSGIMLYYVENKLIDGTKKKGRISINDCMMLRQGLQFCNDTCSGVQYQTQDFFTRHDFVLLLF